MFKPAFLRAALLASACSFGVVTPALAQQQTQTFDIAAGDLASALEQYMRQAGVELVYSRDAVAGKTTQGVQGSFSREEALERLLAGSGLQSRRDASGAILVANRVSPTQLGAADPASSVADEQIVVTGTRLRGGFNPSSPVTVIDQADIEATGYSTAQDLFDSVPQNNGSGPSIDSRFNPISGSLNYGSGTAINLRGLGATSTLVLIDGRRVAATSFGNFVDVSALPLGAIERIEILTDGSSAIYGSDAVGGVVNILLRDDFEGVEARARYGTTTSGSRNEQLYSLAGGVNWTSGNLVATAQYQEFDPLFTNERGFASAVVSPSHLLPASTTANVILSGRQDLNDSLTVSGDLLYSDKEATRVDSILIGGPQTLTDLVDDRSLSAALEVDYEITDSWTVSLTGSYGRDTIDREQTRDRSGVVTRSLEDVEFETQSIEAVSNLTLWTSGAGDTELAVGASHRSESMQRTGVGFTGSPFARISNERSVDATFAELGIPLVSEDQNIPLVRGLRLNAAIRYDDYSEFGSTTNPYVGIRWDVVEGLSVRGTYGTSFRAPTLLEDFQSQSPGQIFSLGSGLFTLADGSSVPVLFRQGTQQNLRPEEAESFTVGADLAVSDNARFSVTYYDIAYTGRIALPPFDTLVLARPDIYGDIIGTFASDQQVADYLNAATATGVTFVDAGGGPGPGIRHLVDLRTRNISELDQRGLDINASYERPFGFGTFSASASVSYIFDINTQFLGASVQTDRVNTLGSPAELKARFGIGYDSENVSANIGINYVSGYVNSSILPSADVDSWTTVDVAIRPKIGRMLGLSRGDQASLGLTVQNIFDVDPPFVSFGFPEFINYDPANAGPLGRFVAVDLRVSF